MEVRDVTPCMDCEISPEAIKKFYARERHYAWYEVFGESVLLCDGCAEEFAHYTPEYFNIPGSRSVGLGSSTFHAHGPLPESEMKVTKDKYCPKCQKRLAFLRFVNAVRSKSFSEKTAAVEVSAGDLLFEHPEHHE